MQRLPALKGAQALHAIPRTVWVLPGGPRGCGANSHPRAGGPGPFSEGRKKAIRQGSPGEAHSLLGGLEAGTQGQRHTTHPSGESRMLGRDQIWEAGGRPGQGDPMGEEPGRRQARGRCEQKAWI